MAARRWAPVCATVLAVALAGGVGVGAGGGPRVGAQPRAPQQVIATEADWARRVGWPTELPVPGITAIASAGVVVTQHRYPDRVTELRVRGSGNEQEIWQRWTDAVRRAGGTIEAEHAGSWGKSASVCPRECARGRFFASVVTDSWVWWTLRPAVARAPAAPGACVAVPDDRWRICWTTGSRVTQCSMPLSTRWDLDLDRDGFPDARVPQPRPRDPAMTCPQDVEWDLYVARADCGHAVGRLRGDVSLWWPAEAELVGGWITLATDVDPPGPWDSMRHLRYAFRGGEYRQVRETRDVARCDVHPADCEEMSRTVCAVRDHPTIVSPFDSDAASARLHALAEAAQQACSAGIGTPIRCAVDLNIVPNGSVTQLRVRGCDARRRCVTGVFQAATFTRFAGEPISRGISFQLPAPVPTPPSSP